MVASPQQPTYRAGVSVFSDSRFTRDWHSNESVAPTSSVSASSVIRARSMLRKSSATAVTSASGLTRRIRPRTAPTLGRPIAPRSEKWRPTSSGGSVSTSIRVKQPTPARAAMSARALPTLPAPTTTRCFCLSNSRSFWLRAKTRSASSLGMVMLVFLLGIGMCLADKLGEPPQCLAPGAAAVRRGRMDGDRRRRLRAARVLLSRAKDHCIFRDDLQRQEPRQRIIHFEEVRIDGEALSSALGDPSDEIRQIQQPRMQRQELRHGPVVMSGEPLHTERVHVQRTDPFERRKRLSEPVELTVHILGIRLVKPRRVDRARAGTHGGERYAHPVLARAKQSYACLKTFSR